MRGDGAVLVGRGLLLLLGAGLSGAPGLHSAQAGDASQGDRPTSRDGFTSIGPHPDAAEQRTADGRRIRALTGWRGKLYVGFGDSNANTGPIAITPWDPEAEQFVPTGFLADTEAIAVFRPIGERLYAPSDDPHGASDLVFGEPWTNCSVVPGYHLYDVASHDGEELWLCGKSSPKGAGAIWRSLDVGQSWKLSLEVPAPEGLQTSFFFLGVLDGEVWAQAWDYAPRNSRKSAPRATSWRFDGEQWKPGPDLLPESSRTGYGHPGIDRGIGYRPLYFAPARRLVYSNGLGKWMGSRGKSGTSILYAFDGDEVEVVREDALDFAIEGDRLFVLQLDGELHHTRDLVEWERLATAPAGTMSLGFAAGSLYVGGDEAALFRYDGALPVR